MPLSFLRLVFQSYLTSILFSHSDWSIQSLVKFYLWMCHWALSVNRILSGIRTISLAHWNKEFREHWIVIFIFTMLLWQARLTNGRAAVHILGPHNNDWYQLLIDKKSITRQVVWGDNNRLIFNYYIYSLHILFVSEATMNWHAIISYSWHTLCMSEIITDW